MRLSDLYAHKDEIPNLELVVIQYNINNLADCTLMDRCEPLKEYSEFIGNGILKDFLTNNRNEVRSMSLFEFDAEEHEKAIKQIAYEEGELDGAARGEQVGRIKMLYELGNTIPEIAVKLNISEESVKDIIKA